MRSPSAYVRPGIVQPGASCDPAATSTLNATEDGQLKGHRGKHHEHATLPLPYRRRCWMNQTANAPTPAICREFPATSVAADGLGTDNRMTVTHVTNIRTEELIAVAAAQDDEQQQAASLALSHRVVPTGEVIVDID